MALALLQRPNGIGHHAVATQPLRVRLRLIGQMEAWTLDEESIVPIGRKTRALLAILALSTPRPMLRGKLAELLWSRRHEDQARASLRQEIHRLLEALNPAGANILNIQRDHLMLRPGTVWVDVEEIMRATPARPAALSLLDGELLEDLDGIDGAFDAWLAAERERLRDRARELAEAVLREQTEPDTVVAAAQQLLAIDKSHEGSWRALMRAYADRGERGMAIQAYERCRLVLADQLDAQPSEETQALLADIRVAAPRASGQPLSRPAIPPAPLDPGAAAIRSPNARHDRPHERIGDSVAPVPERGRARPRIGVLPVTLVGSAQDDAHLGTALAEEITAALARFQSLNVVASGALTRLAGPGRDDAVVRRSAGVDFLLEGTLQRSATRARASLRLTDLRAGNEVIWVRRFDGDAADLLALQDEISDAAAAEGEQEAMAATARRALARAPGEASAQTLTLCATASLGRLEPATVAQTGSLLRQAIVLDPECGEAHATLVLWTILQLEQGRAADTDAAIAEAERAAECAVSLDPHDAAALTIAGYVRVQLLNRPDDALAMYERALRLNPHLALAWNFSGLAHACLGNAAEAERRLSRYKALTPNAPLAFFLDTTLVLAALLRRDHAAAVGLGREVAEMNPAFSGACKPYLAALGHLDRREDADVVRRRLLRLEPQFSVRRYLAQTGLAEEADRLHVAEGLRRAGVME